MFTGGLALVVGAVLAGGTALAPATSARAEGVGTVAARSEVSAGGRAGRSASAPADKPAEERPDGSEEKAAEAAVRAATTRYRAAARAQALALDGVAAAFALGARADADALAAQLRYRRARAVQGRLVRTLYATGRMGLLEPVLTAPDAEDALWRAATTQRVLTGMALAAGAVADQERARERAAQERARAGRERDSRAASSLATAREQERLAGVALAQAQAALGEIRADAVRDRLADDLARARAAAARRAEAATSTAGSAGAAAIPLRFLAAYQGAAPTCPGMDWTLLAAVGQVESGHGRNNGPSSAGAVGPMQFMPATFRAYAVDGNGDGSLDPWSPEDAVWTAAAYLCASGARGGSEAGVRRALFAYNHAQWYVDLVLAARRAIRAQSSR